MERVWGYTSVLDTGTVTVHVRRLREKIEDDPSRPRHLETVWGSGYRLDAMIELAILLALGTIVVGAIAALLSDCSRRCVCSLPRWRCSPWCCRCRRVRLGLGHVRDARRRRGAGRRPPRPPPRPCWQRSCSPGGSARRWTACATTSARLAAGDLSARASEHGPAELVEMAHSFNSMADSIERLFEARRELVAWASHDLRTPLASMQAMLEAIDDGLAEPAEYMPLSADRVRTLSGLVEDLFELGRIDAGVLTLHLRRADLGEVVGGCVHGFEAEARAKGIDLQTRAVATLPSVLCAPERSSASCTTCSRTHSATRPPTARSRSS